MTTKVYILLFLVCSSCAAKKFEDSQVYKRMKANETYYLQTIKKQDSLIKRYRKSKSHDKK